MKLVSWNVNGLRAALRGDFRNFLAAESPDVLCLQEVKAERGDVDEAVFHGWHVHWNSAEKKGYSGVVLASREQPLDVRLGMGVREHDREGRVITAEFADFHVVNVYTPNSQRGLLRLDYRLEWDAAFRHYVRTLDKEKPVLFCGDLNCAHAELDLANPKQNRRNAGFTDEERSSLTKLLDTGFADSFRRQHPGAPGHYTWWTWRSDARARNIGWRIDYWMVAERLWPRVKKAGILGHVHGSDHCPVSLELA